MAGAAWAIEAPPLAFERRRRLTEVSAEPPRAADRLVELAELRRKSTRFPAVSNVQPLAPELEPRPLAPVMPFPNRRQRRRWRLAPRASATVVHSQELSNGTATSAVTITPTNAPTVGNAVILCISCVTKTRTISSITDNGSNTGWGQLSGGGGSSFGSCFIWWLPNVVHALTTITITQSGTSKTQVGYLEVSGLTGVADPVGASTNQSASTTPAQAVTTTNADDFIVQGIGCNTATASAVSAPFSPIQLQANTAGINNVVCWSEQTSTGTYTATWTLTSSVVSTTASAAFKVATSGNVTISAGVCAATAAGVSDTPNVIQLPSPSSATAAGVAPVPNVLTATSAAAATAAARAPTPEIDQLPGAAAASAAAVAVVPHVAVPVGVCSATAQAIHPVLEGLAVSVSVGVCAAIAAAVAPMESTRKSADLYKDRGWADRDVWLQPDSHPPGGWVA